MYLLNYVFGIYLLQLPSNIFILIHNSNTKISSTLNSRCIKFKINLSFEKTINATNKLINNDIFNLLHKDFINYYSTVGNYINLVAFSKYHKFNLFNCNLEQFISLILKNNLYKKNNESYIDIFFYIELLFIKILNKTTNKNKIFNLYYYFIKKFYHTKKYNLEYESLFMEFESKLLNG